MADLPMQSNTPPYAGDLRAKGWRFEIDTERIRQSDTWALAPAEMRPWLLMLWMTAWEQSPCGSLPNADDLIAARIGMPAKLFAKHRAVLLRGWWLATDGRLYHHVITQQVLVMQRQKDGDRRRQAEKRVRDEQRRAAEMGAGLVDESSDPEGGDSRDEGVIHTEVTAESRVTNARESRMTNAKESRVTNATGTGTSTNTENPGAEVSPGVSPASGGARARVRTREPGQSPAVDVCRAMVGAGLSAREVRAGDPRIAALLAQGAQPAEFVAIAAEASAKGKGLAWALAALEGRRADASAIQLAALQATGSDADAAATAARLAALHEHGRAAVGSQSARAGAAAVRERLGLPPVRGRA